MSGGAIAFCLNVVIFIVMLGLMILISEVEDRCDTYKGVRNLSRYVRDEMRHRWLHSRCLTGHGHHCSSCRKYDECYKECEEQMKRDIDAEQEGEVAK